MDLWQSLAGQLHLELTSAELEEALGAYAARNIPLLQLQRQGELSCRFWIHRRDYEALQSLARRRGDSLKLLRRRGLYWHMRNLLRRPVLLAGLALLVGATLYLPSRVLFVRVEGNAQIPAGQILAAAEQCGISFWAQRRDVRSERVKNALLEQLPGLQWAGVNTSGCVATISVRERRSFPERMPTGVSQMYAAVDGYVVSAIATSGTLLVQPGQTVRRGQKLISGYTDCGLCIQAGQAQGEVFAQTERTLRAVTPEFYLRRGPLLEKNRRFSLLLGKKRINFGKGSGISGSSCGRMYEEYYVTLPGGFRLPAALCVETQLRYDTTMQRLSAQQAQAALSDFAQRYLHQQMLAGQIQSSRCQLRRISGGYQLEGAYRCLEMIGRLRQEQIGADNG